MRLSELRAVLVAAHEHISDTITRDADLRRVTADSRAVRPGSVFVAIRGNAEDGHRYIPAALKAGAAAVISERSLRLPVPCLRVRHAYRAFGFAASAVCGNLRNPMRLFAVTGTNGKTTTAYLIRHLLGGMGVKTALIGTVTIDIPGRKPRPADITTPDAGTLNDVLRDARAAGCGAAVMEISSHALTQDRAAGLTFESVIFTNLTQDHLDYHKTIENYFQAKRRLFVDYAYGKAVINADDPHGRRLAAELKSLNLPAVTFGRRAGSDLRLTALRSGLRGSRLSLNFHGKRCSASMRLLGGYNAMNAAGALLACARGPADLPRLLKRLATAAAPPGRMEQVEAGQPYPVVVDYAHSPDALEQLLRCARGLKPRRLVAVFGCGGDRDRGKRPKMARIATRLADYTVVTSDNPRTEDPQRIIGDIRPGLVGHEGRRYVILPDRREAIFHAAAACRARDLLVIAGKGHEDYQILGTRKIHFDDRETARAAIETAGAARPNGRGSGVSRC